MDRLKMMRDKGRVPGYLVVSLVEDFECSELTIRPREDFDYRWLFGLNIMIVYNDDTAQKSKELQEQLGCIAKNLETWNCDANCYRWEWGKDVFLPPEWVPIQCGSIQ